ncbi:uncharacterized protein [Argopecten irradians]|uniref:uncharacterized protein n=1 Tax=Argopecten irradians TaxID=31199 RepID=UPI0037178584
MPGIDLSAKPPLPPRIPIKPTSSSKPEKEDHEMLVTMPERRSLVYHLPTITPSQRRQMKSSHHLVIPAGLQGRHRHQPDRLTIMSTTVSGFQTMPPITDSELQVRHRHQRIRLDNVKNGAKNLASPRSAASTSTSTNNVKSNSIMRGKSIGLLRDYHDELSRETILESENGESLPAIQVFAAVIAFFKAKLLDDLNGKGTSFHNSDIHWVLTVPAIWNLKAKQFMKEASNLW